MISPNSIVLAPQGSTNYRKKIRMDLKLLKKRVSERFLVVGPVKYTCATSKEIFEGNIINCSAEGIRFETFREIQPGTIIFIANVGDNKYFRAEVKWCKNLVSDHSDIFNVGAEYLDSDRPKNEDMTHN